MIDKDIKKLENLVKALEEGELGLDDNLSVFQEGMQLIENCRNTLEKAELKVKEIIAKQGGDFDENVLDT